MGWVSCSIQVCVMVVLVWMGLFGLVSFMRVRVGRVGVVRHSGGGVCVSWGGVGVIVLVLVVFVEWLEVWVEGGWC